MSKCIKMLPVAEQHAELWGELVFEERRIDGPFDVTHGWHPVLGRCVISYSTCSAWAEWIRQSAIFERDEAPTLAS